MSVDKNRANAVRWFSQAESDIKASEFSKKAKKYEWSCFQAQQAGEKILKALWYYFSYEPWGHSIFKLIIDFPDRTIYNEHLLPLQNPAKDLDKLYIPTRYPNGLPELAPYEVYTEEDAERAIAEGNKILETIGRLIQYSE